MIMDPFRHKYLAAVRIGTGKTGIQMLLFTKRKIFPDHLAPSFL